MGYAKEIRKLVGTRPIIIVGSAVLLQNNTNDLLLVQRKDNGLWGLPAGTLELGEALEECALRELEEETGLKASKLQFLQVVSGKDFYHSYPNGDEVYIVCAAFLCKEYSGVACVNDDESLGVSFFPIEALPDDLNPPSAKLITSVLEQGLL